MIKPINESFDISSGEALNIWQSGHGLWRPEASGRLRVSSNGEWLARFNPVRSLCYPVKSVCSELSLTDFVRIVDREMSRLKTYGVNIISYATAPAADETGLLTVSPMIEDIEPCSIGEFDEIIVPAISLYLRNPPDDTYVLSDIGSNQQFSTSAKYSPRPFLHDVDPYIGSSASTVTSRLLREQLGVEACLPAAA